MKTRARPPASPPFTARVVPAGDSAQMLELSDRLDLAANAKAQRIAELIRAASLDGVSDVIAAIASVTVQFEADDAVQASARREAISFALLEALQDDAPATSVAERSAVEIPVCYENAHAPDLAEVAAATGMSPDEVVRLHTASDHRVLMIGFTPGFPYIGGLDARLSVPRRPTPRARLPAGSVAIANGQTAIYPSATPGGWNLIGRTPLRLFDPLREPPSLLQAGDRIVFVPISAAEYARRAGS